MLFDDPFWSITDTTITIWRSLLHCERRYDDNFPDLPANWYRYAFATPCVMTPGVFDAWPQSNICWWQVLAMFLLVITYYSYLPLTSTIITLYLFYIVLYWPTLTWYTSIGVAILLLHDDPRSYLTYYISCGNLLEEPYCATITDVHWSMTITTTVPEVYRYTFDDRWFPLCSALELFCDADAITVMPINYCILYLEPNRPVVILTIVMTTCRWC